MKERTRIEQSQPEGRMTIASMSQQRCSVRAKAQTLHGGPLTISRELRNTADGKAYGYHVAQQACQALRCAAKHETKLGVDGFDWLSVLELLDWRWSPQKISGTLKRVFPNDRKHHVSHETIYTAIYVQPRGELRRQLIARLRQGHGTRMPRTRGMNRRGQSDCGHAQHPCAPARDRGLNDARTLGE